VANQREAAAHTRAKPVGRVPRRLLCQGRGWPAGPETAVPAPVVRPGR